RGYKKYLGLPAWIGKSRKSMFQSLKDHVWGKLKGWKEKSLSVAGKEVLIKAVASLPTYFMSIFKLPIMLYKELTSIIFNFSWAKIRIKAKMLKAKYYRYGHFLNAQISHCPSYTWRSIRAAIPVLRRGLKWRIVNGM
ncbi:LOW QUALITY PROTEIN: hypothetical protein CFOL_v3_18707, partial [Cephalotus follicularis]